MTAHRVTHARFDRMMLDALADVLPGYAIEPGDTPHNYVARDPDGTAVVNFRTSNQYRYHLAGEPAELVIRRFLSTFRAGKDTRGGYGAYALAAPSLRIQLISPAHDAELHETIGSRQIAPLTYPGPVGLTAAVRIDREQAIGQLMLPLPADWPDTELVIARAVQNTRNAVKAAKAVSNTFGGVTMHMWDAPSGYACSRLMFPELFPPEPPGGGRLLYAPNRDTLIMITLTRLTEETARASMLAVKAVKQAAAGEPYQLLPHTPLAIIEGAIVAFAAP